MFVVQFIQDFKGWPMSKQKIGVLGDFVPMERNLAAPGFIKRTMSISGGGKRGLPKIHVFNTN